MKRKAKPYTITNIFQARDKIYHLLDPDQVQGLIDLVKRYGNENVSDAVISLESGDMWREHLDRLPKPEPALSNFLNSKLTK